MDRLNITIQDNTQYNRVYYRLTVYNTERHMLLLDTMKHTDTGHPLTLESAFELAGRYVRGD